MTRPTFYNRFRGPLDLLLTVLEADLAEVYQREERWRAVEKPSNDGALRRATSGVVEYLAFMASADLPAGNRDLMRSSSPMDSPGRSRPGWPTGD
ncbi:hypothetical protein [Kribbella sp. NBC_00889]|uniref:hypothetical protein n=1 Tax=Kribbella sp. NBC_00889 TaxID=2975974 RepID=UPI00386E587D|nr:hypothetical protein OG817_08110 [Kribbella sp. NBC_00889]